MTRYELKESSWIVVLNDGHTFAGLDGCWVGMTTPEQVQESDESGEIPDGIKEVTIRALLEWAIDRGFFD